MDEAVADEIDLPWRHRTRPAKMPIDRAAPGLDHQFSGLPDSRSTLKLLKPMLNFAGRAASAAIVLPTGAASRLTVQQVKVALSD